MSMNVIEEKFRELVGDIDEAIVKIEAGEGSGLEALNERIANMCSPAHIAEAALDHNMKQPIAALILKLDELAVCIRSYQDRVRKAN